VQLTALGCGEATIAFLHFKEIRDLKITVDVGLVDGISAATTPIGSAIFNNFPLLRISITPTVFRSFIDS